MKKKILSVLVLLVVIITISPMTQAQAAVKLSKAKATMEVDSTLKLKISGTKSKVSWKSSDKSVAKVSDKGVVTAKAEGTATITATVDKEKYTCKIVVIDSSSLPETIGGGLLIGGQALPDGVTVFLHSEEEIQYGALSIYTSQKKYEDMDWASYKMMAGGTYDIVLSVVDGYYYDIPTGSYTVSVR